MRIAITRREALDVPDGINIFIFSLAEALMEQGHHVAVVSTLAADKQIVRSMFGLRNYPELVSLKRHSGGRHIDAGRIWLVKGRGAIRAIRPDAILINGALPVRFTSWSCAISHDSEGGGRGFTWLRRLYKFYAYRNVDQIVSTTSEIREALSAEIRVPMAKIRRIPTCVNQNLYLDAPYARRDRAILHMGTIWYKNPQATIRAFERLADDGACLYVTGNAAHIPRDLLSELSPRIRERIVFVGHLPADELRRLLGQVMLVSVPSDYVVPVASPTVIESLSAGTPVVGSLGISRDVLIDGYNGFRCDVRDLDGLAQRYQQLLNDRDLWTALHSGCRDSALQFSANAVATTYLQLIESRHSTFR